MVDILDERFPELGLKKQAKAKQEVQKEVEQAPKKRGRKPKTK